MQVVKPQAALLLVRECVGGASRATRRRDEAVHWSRAHVHVSDNSPPTDSLSAAENDQSCSNPAAVVSGDSVACLRLICCDSSSRLIRHFYVYTRFFFPPKGLRHFSCKENGERMSLHWSSRQADRKRQRHGRQLDVWLLSAGEISARRSRRTQLLFTAAIQSTLLGFGRGGRTKISEQLLFVSEGEEMKPATTVNRVFIFISIEKSKVLLKVER